METESLPPDTKYAISAVLCTMGHFELPPFCDLVSAVYRIQPKSSFNCKEVSLQMSVSHCVTIEDRDDVTFIAAKISEGVPFSFKCLKQEGSLCERSKKGVIALDPERYDLLAVARFIKRKSYSIWPLSKSVEVRSQCRYYLQVIYVVHQMNASSSEIVAEESVEDTEQDLVTRASVHFVITRDYQPLTEVLPSFICIYTLALT